MIPEAWESEDGGVWWMRGHVAPESAVLAVLVERMANCGAEEAFDLVAPLPGDQTSPHQAVWTNANEMLKLATHTWARPLPNGESWEHCAADAEGAEPWTVVSF